jgi:hypothetical protein
MQMKGPDFIEVLYFLMRDMLIPGARLAQLSVEG